MHQWSLFVFTLAVQVAAGGFICLGLVAGLLRLDGQRIPPFRLPIFAFTAFVLLGLAASFHHLGEPSGFYRVFYNVGSSWLSREAFLCGLFGVLAAGCTWQALMRKSVSLRLLAGTALAGVLGVFSMGMVYENTVLARWTTVNTTFFATTLLCGGVLNGFLLVPGLRARAAAEKPGEGWKELLKIVRRVVSFVCGVGLVLLLLSFVDVAPIAVDAQLWSCLLTAGGLGLGSCALFQTSTGRMPFSLATLLVLLGEATARYQFFLGA